MIYKYSKEIVGNMKSVHIEYVVYDGEYEGFIFNMSTYVAGGI